MKVYTVIWSDRGPDQRLKIYSRLSDAKAKITTRINGYNFKKYYPRTSGVILESEIKWTPWKGK